MAFAIQFIATWFSHNFFLVVASVVFTYLFIRVIYNLFLSPLSAIPGPWYAAISDLWITIHVVRLRQCQTIQELFEVYGPVVRIGPNKVVFRDISTMRSVYTVHKFDKSNYYKSLLTFVFFIAFPPSSYLPIPSSSNDNDHAYVYMRIYATIEGSFPLV